jgi:hypothetical protein
MSIEAVIFDWGGTLTRWHDVDFHAAMDAGGRATRAVVCTSETGSSTTCGEPTTQD